MVLCCIAKSNWLWKLSTPCLSTSDIDEDFLILCLRRLKSIQLPLAAIISMTWPQGPFHFVSSTEDLPLWTMNAMQPDFSGDWKVANYIVSKADFLSVSARQWATWWFYYLGLFFPTLVSVLQKRDLERPKRDIYLSIGAQIIDQQTAHVTLKGVTCPHHSMILGLACTMAISVAELKQSPPPHPHHRHSAIQLANTFNHYHTHLLYRSLHSYFSPRILVLYIQVLE